jgi:precorrin-6B methylase 2
MMGTVISGSAHLIVSTTNPSSYVSNYGQMAGSVRYNTNTQALEVYDGINWIQQDNCTVINTTPELDRVIKWAKEKMYEEDQLHALAKTNESIQFALENLKTAKQQLNLIKILVQENNTTTKPQ